MFYNAERNTMLLKLYTKSRAIGHVPTFDEINKMEDMPAANTFALYCKEYARAAAIVDEWLNLSHMPSPRKGMPEELRKEMRKQDALVRDGWIPIQTYVPQKTLGELLDEVMEQADRNGILPSNFQVSNELTRALNI